MRCKKHPTDLSSTMGVCASCLREKLLPLLALQSPPLIFPRSISPPPLDRDPNPPSRLFFSTPQLGPTGSIKIEPVQIRERSKFSLLPNMFRSRSEQVATSPSSWLSSLFSRRKKRQARLSSVDESTIGGRRGFPGRGRGMSPARVSDCGKDGEVDIGGSRGYSSVRQTPLRAVPARRRCRAGGLRSDDVAGFCLSPMVWPSPRRQWNQTLAAPEVAFATGKPHLSNAVSFCKSRSRKIADFGRFDHRK